MVFSSLVFIYLFLPLSLILYFACKNIVWRNAVLAVFSFVFYAWGEPVWVLLLVATCLANYMVGLSIQKYEGTPKSKIFLVVGVVISVTPLVIFKYLGLFVNTFTDIFGIASQGVHFALPIGISFYTFQILTYIIDVYRKEVPAQRSMLNFFLFVSLFPQLVAGPILRYGDVAQQIESRKVTVRNMTRGITRFCVGLAKKVLIANAVGDIADLFLGGGSTLSVLGSWYGVLAYAFQIYFDFSGYSDMAIGLGHMFGFQYKENFNYPYTSGSITEFWRRWHISLSSFFRDYVYIPLGGSRTGRTTRNLFIVWALTGLWHGGSWNFLIWGLFYFALLVVEKRFLLNGLQRIPKLIGNLYTMLFVMIGWVLFYYTDFSQVFSTLGSMFGISASGFSDAMVRMSFSSNIFLLIAAAIACIPISKFVRLIWDHLERKNYRSKRFAQIVNAVFNLALLLFSTTMLIGQSYNPFLYFNF
ncbi:MAG: MBOAT family O-acyltransferase [Christensenellales bacterium]